MVIDYEYKVQYGTKFWWWKILTKWGWTNFDEWMLISPFDRHLDCHAYCTHFILLGMHREKIIIYTSMHMHLHMYCICYKQIGHTFVVAAGYVWARWRARELHHGMYNVICLGVLVWCNIHSPFIRLSIRGCYVYKDRWIHHAIADRQRFCCKWKIAS